MNGPLHLFWQQLLGRAFQLLPNQSGKVDEIRFRSRRHNYVKHRAEQRTRLKGFDFLSQGFLVHERAVKTSALPLRQDETEYVQLGVISRENGRRMPAEIQSREMNLIFQSE